MCVARPETWCFYESLWRASPNHHRRLHKTAARVPSCSSLWLPAASSSSKFLRAGLAIVHSWAADPVAAFGELFRTAELPPLMRSGVMEPKLLRHYVLLHDEQAPDAATVACVLVAFVNLL